MAQRQWRSDDTDPWVYGFGDGSDGSSYAVPSNEGCSGSSGGTSLTLAAAGSFSNGDLVLIHQSRGSGAGNWELNKIASGGGTTSLTMEHDLMNTYTDSGDNQAQIIEMKQYDGLTTGSITAPAWTGSDGGIIAFFDKGACTVNGTLNGDGKGFTGYSGTVSTSSDYAGKQGEGYPGAGGSNTRSANGSGAGGGAIAGGAKKAGGGGGGNANTGSAGVNSTDGPLGGIGGSSFGNSALTSFTHGGGGGQGSYWGGNGGGNAGEGGGSILIFAKDIIITGVITADGGNGQSAANGRGGCGGGAGGNVLLKCVTATLGTSKIGVSGGTGGATFDSNGGGGNGSVGRIHLDYSGSYTGTTSPTLDATLDSTIVSPSSGGGNPMFFSKGLTLG